MDLEYHIYVLLCQDETYYVGRTQHPDFRIDDHFNSMGSAWTRVHKPIKVVEMFSGDEYDEDKTVLKYMNKYGIDSVRGGTYSQIALPPNVIYGIKQQLHTVNGTCFHCSSKNHYAQDCPKKKLLPKRVKKCKRCGRSSHTRRNCYAKRDVDGEPIIDCCW